MADIFPSHWIARPNGDHVLPEYLPSLRQICILASIHVSTSQIRNIIQKLSEKGSLHLQYFIHQLLDQIIPKIFPGQSTFIAVVEMDYHGSLKADIQGLYQRYGWEKKYLQCALSILKEKEDIRLRSLLGLLGRAQRECDARKRMAFSTVLSSVSCYVITTPPEESTKSQSKMFSTVSSFFSLVSFFTSSEETKSSRPSSVVKPSSSSLPVDQTIDFAKLQIFQFAVEKIEEQKQKAFYSIFIEPNIFYFTQVGDHVAAGDVDVHGANTLISLLLGTTGISIPRLPLIEDGLVGFTDYLMAGFSEELKHELFRPNNIGKSYEVCINAMKKTHQERLKAQLKKGPAETTVPVPATAPSLFRDGRVNPSCGNGVFLFNTQRRCHLARDLVDIAINPALSIPDQRKRYANYLLLFTNYFRAESILQVLWNELIQADRYRSDMETVFQSMKASGRYSIEKRCDSLQEWLWTMPESESFSDIAFNAVNAQAFFAECNICKSLP